MWGSSRARVRDYHLIRSSRIQTAILLTDPSLLQARMPNRYRKYWYRQRWNYSPPTLIGSFYWPFPSTFCCYYWVQQPRQVFGTEQNNEYRSTKQNTIGNDVMSHECQKERQRKIKESFGDQRLPNHNIQLFNQAKRNRKLRQCDCAEPDTLPLRSNQWKTP